MKILMIGHACSPYLGSEPGFTWNWAWHLSQRHQVWVIAYPEFQADVESYLQAYPSPNLQICWVRSNSRWDFWDPTKSERGIRWHYWLWLQQALRVAQLLHQQHQFDLVHHVSLGTINVPSPFWQLNIPFIWGPIGGGQTFPWAFRDHLHTAWKQELARWLLTSVLKFHPAIQRTAQQCDLVLVTNRETRELVAHHSKTVRTLLDAGLPAHLLPEQHPHRPVQDPLTILWAGRLEARKGLGLGLQALVQLSDLPLQLRIAGEGPLESLWRQEVVQLQLTDRVTFLGRVPWRQMVNLFRSSDLFLFTSLRDSFGSVVLEAMGQGLPIVTLDHQGVGDHVPATAGIKVPVTTPEPTIAALAQGLRQLYSNPALRHQMGHAAWTYAQSQTWDQRAQRMDQYYQEVCCAHRHF